MAITDLVVPGPRRSSPPVSRDRQVVWRAWGTTASVTVDDPAALNAARRIVARQFLAAEKAAARFRSDAELHKLYRAGGRAITVSPLLAELVAAALAVAERTDGDVDPTVGAAMTAVANRAAVRSRSAYPVCSSGPTKIRPASGWETVRLEGRRLRVPAGTTLDLSATAKSAICDLAAAQVRERMDSGVLVQLGGNAASAGPAPAEGWRVSIEDRDRRLSTEVYLTAGSALATTRSSTPQFPRDQHHLRRDHARDCPPISYVIDPHTGELPLPVWRMASAIGFNCLEASTYATASMVRGTRAASWLTQLWVPSRLVTVNDHELLAGNWAAHTEPQEEEGTN